MSNMEEHDASIDQASRSLPAFIFGGCIGGLLLGVIFDSIPYGVAIGLVLALVMWLANKHNIKRAPDRGADAQ